MEVTETLINRQNYIQYQINYWNEYNQDKCKRRNITNLLLGMEENNKDTTKTQGKTTPTVW